MEKKIRFILLFCISHLLYTPILKSTPLNPLHDASHYARAIDLPAPENFRITSVSNNSISLAWSPVSFSSTYTLEILREDSANNWNSVTTIYNLPDSSYIATGLTSGTYYRFIIATNDESGEPSEEKAFLEGITLIVELTTYGKVPESPDIVNGCVIDYHNKPWVGFKIQHSEIANVYNYFDITAGVTFSDGVPIAGEVDINRALLNQGIFAANNQNVWPTENDPSIGCNFLIKILHVTSENPLSFIHVGNIVINLTPINIFICINEDPLLGSPKWNDNYTFTLLQEKPKLGEGEVINKRTYEPKPDSTILQVQTLFEDALNIKMNDSDQRLGSTVINLINLNGIVEFHGAYSDLVNDISISTRDLLPGFYILQICTEGHSNSIKVLKTTR